MFEAVRISGADGQVYTQWAQIKANGAGNAGTVVIPGVAKKKIRIVGGIWSADGVTQAQLYHGAATLAAVPVACAGTGAPSATSQKVIASAMYAQFVGAVLNIGVYGPKVGLAGEPVCLNNPDANIDITLQYVLTE